jgi:hypothetical protein
LGEETGDEPPDPLVETSDETVDRLVLMGDGPVTLPAAVRARTARDPLDIVRLVLRHRPLPP